MERLQAMQLVAKMKESAERHGIGFIGGFIAPNGEKFVMTNMKDQDDIDQLMPEDLKVKPKTVEYEESVIIDGQRYVLSTTDYSAFINRLIRENLLNDNNRDIVDHLGWYAKLDES
jgi:rRNA maturation endonuclease Nob1